MHLFHMLKLYIKIAFQLAKTIKLYLLQCSC